MNTQHTFDTLQKMSQTMSWKQLLAGSVTTADQLAQYLPVNTDDINHVIGKYPLRINPYYLSLIKQVGDPVWKQAVPDIAECSNPAGMDDPLDEEPQSPVLHLTHRYPDRVLFLVSDQCAMYCRHCMRKRKVGDVYSARTPGVSNKTIAEGMAYIRGNKSIRDVLVSGGDPLLLSDDKLAAILAELRSVPHVEIIRIHTRVPCTLPQRVTVRLADMLKRFHPLYINTHFNHPVEVTPEASRACALLADAGIPLGCQTVLLKGVNDDPLVMKHLMHELVKIRVRPYYIHHPDWVKGTAHFRPSIRRGLAIMEKLRGATSGLCVPQYMIDLPGGGGKVPLLPEYIMGLRDGMMQVRNYQGKIYSYPAGEETDC